MREGDSQEGGAGMVVIDYPDNTCHKFFQAENTFFGPLDQNGNYRAVQVPMDLHGGLFEPERRIYGENNILHSTIHGKVFYYPILADCIPNPSTTYPRRLGVPVKEQLNPVDVLYGFGCPEIGARVLYSTVSQCSHQTCLRDESGRIYTLIRVMGSNASAQRCYVYVWTWTFKGWKSANEAFFDQTYTYSTSSWPWSHGWNKVPTHLQIIAAKDSVTRWSTPMTGVKTFKVYTTDPQTYSKPSKLAVDLGNFVNSAMGERFALPLADYGVLAARAVQQKKTVDINLFEFLSELPDVKSLIPKFENLTALKTHAGNYLSYKYGVLPTISDVQSLIAAFKKRLPYLDRNGFSAYSASHKQLEVVDNTIFELEQHIKVAVSDVENEFIRLLTVMDEYGIGITYRNMWDLMHLSFAVDWFIDVGSFLKRIDQNQRLLRYNIPYVTMSCKKSVTGEITLQDGLLTLGPVQWRFYHRWVDSHCPLPPLTLSNSPTATSHWLEAGSLIIQRAK